MSFQLSVINPETDNRWDEFVLNHPEGLIYQHSLWGKVVADTYGYQPFYIAMENTETSQFEGILPFMLVNSRLTGKRLVSFPLAAYCSQLLPEQKLSEAIRFAADQHPGIDYIELKFIEKVRNGASSLEEQSLYTTHFLDLDMELEQLLKSFHNNHIRRKIKKAEKGNLKFRISNKEEDLKAFYTLESSVRKKHGLPPQPYSFFANMWRLLKSRDFLLLPVIEYKGQVIASAIMLRFKDTFYYEYSASDSRFWHLGPNQKLIWEIIKIAHREGAKKFDFGRSSLSNRTLIDFKERWGAKVSKLHYYYYPHAKKIGSDNNLLIHKLMSFINRHLPLPLLQLEGKLLYQHLG